jgi:hypothetical protein
LLAGHRAHPELNMTAKSRVLPVYLRGARTYVQGSQILARTGEWLADELGQASLKLAVAKFVRITDCGVEAVFDPAEDNNPAAAGPWIGEARYATPAAPSIVRYRELTGAAAPRIADVPSRIQDFHSCGRLACTAHYTISGSQESFLAATIEIVKRLHAELGPAVSDIWFTGLASAALPIAPEYGQDGSMAVTPLLERPLDGRLLTLSRVSVAAPHAVPPFNIGFSCRLAK